MEQSQTPERILTFLKGLGFGFNSEKGMLEHCRDGKNLLKVIIEVVKTYEPAYLRSILAMECHGISNNMERHKESLPFINDFLVARQIFKATRFTLELKDFLPIPQPQNVYQSRRMAILSHLYTVTTWVKDLKAKYESSLARLNFLQKQQQNLMSEEVKVIDELKEVEKTKLVERQGHDKAMELIARHKEEIATLRNRKTEVMTTKAKQDKDLIDKTKELEQILYRTQQLEIDIAQAKRDISVNAPEVRKEKLKQDALLSEALEMQVQQARNFNNMREIIKNRFTNLENNINKLKHLTFLDELQTRSNNLKADSRRLKVEEERRRELIAQLNSELARMEAEVANEEAKEQKENELILQLKLRKSRAMDTLESKRNEHGSLKRGIEDIITMKRECCDELQAMERSDMEECNAYEQEMRQLAREVQEWNKKTFSVLCDSHANFNSGFFEKGS